MGKEANKSHRTTPKTWKKSKVNQQDMRLEDDHTALQRSHTFKPSRRSARNRVSPSLRMAKLKDKTDKSLIRDHSFDASDADADADDDVLQLTDTDKSERLFDFNSDDVSDNEELFNQREFHALKKNSFEIGKQDLLLNQPNSSRWRNWWVRTLWTVILITGVSSLILSGQLAVILMILAFQTLIFKEVIAIAHVPSKEKKLPWFRLINWYFLLVSNFYLYGDTLFNHFRENVLIDAFLQPLASHHKFSSYILYIIGVVFFVMNLKKGHYKFQFLQFFWTHMTLLVVTFQSHYIISNILEGLIWFVLPASLVVVNDIFAYIGGFFFGKTPLIALSPKKTWEGFIFGFVFTLLYAIFVTGILIQSNYLICPVKDLTLSAWDNIECAKNPVFIPINYKLAPALVGLTKHIFSAPIHNILIAPLQWHALIMACFASSIAPFGGFFASGFKRAFKLKDFGDSIPGHGGFTDRMDCQLLMGMFSYIYYSSFIKTYQEMSVSNVLQTIVEGLQPSDQMELYSHLHEYLVNQALLPE